MVRDVERHTCHSRSQVGSPFLEGALDRFAERLGSAVRAALADDLMDIMNSSGISIIIELKIPGGFEDRIQPKKHIIPTLLGCAWSVSVCAELCNGGHVVTST